MYAEKIQFTKTEIQLVKFIFKHFKDRHNARQLARMLSLNHAHVNKLCDGLVRKGLFVNERIGNAIYYAFNHTHKSALHFMAYLLSLEIREFPPWLAVLLHHLKKFGTCIDLGCVFGSSIRKRDFQDIDILLIYAKARQREVSKIKGSIRRAGLLDKPIRYVEMTEEDALKNKENRIFYSMFSECLIFHNAEKYVEVIQCLR